MDWEQLREATLGEVANTLVTEGVGVGAGWIVSGAVGRRVEDYLLPGGVDGTSWSSIIKGWAYNNVPKLAAWYLIRRYVPAQAETRTQEIAVDAKKAIAGSVVFDTILRAANHGLPVQDPSSYKILGGKAPVKAASPVAAAPQADMQRLIQENSALRTELNKALQRLAAPAPAPQPVQVAAPAPNAELQRLTQEIGSLKSELSRVAQAAQQRVAAPVQPVQVAAPIQTVRTPAPAPAPSPIRVAAPVQPTPVRVAAPVQPAPQVNVAPVQTAPQVNVTPLAPTAPVVRYQPAPVKAAAPVVRVEQQQPVPPAIAERERRFAFMPTHNAPDDVQKREDKYGFAGRSSEKEIAAMFNML